MSAMFFFFSVCLMLFLIYLFLLYYLILCQIDIFYCAILIPSLDFKIIFLVVSLGIIVYILIYHSPLWINTNLIPVQYWVYFNITVT